MNPTALTQLSLERILSSLNAIPSVVIEAPAPSRENNTSSAGAVAVRWSAGAGAAALGCAFLHAAERLYPAMRRLVRRKVIPSGVIVRLDRHIRVNPDLLEEFMTSGGGAVIPPMTQGNVERRATARDAVIDAIGRGLLSGQNLRITAANIGAHLNGQGNVGCLLGVQGEADRDPPAPAEVLLIPSTARPSRIPLPEERR